MFIGNYKQFDSKMQQKMDLVLAYANKIALALAIKEHSVNQKMIQQEGRPVYSLNLMSSQSSFRRVTGPNGDANAKEESSLCHAALDLFSVGMMLSRMFDERQKIIIKKSFTERQVMVKEEDQENYGVIYLPYDSLAGLNFRSKKNQQKIRKYVLENYKKTPREINLLIRSLNIPLREVRNWINYSKKGQRRLLLRKEVMRLAVHQDVSYEQFKMLAKSVYKTRNFGASDSWCVNYIKRYQLEHLIDIPSRLLEK